MFLDSKRVVEHPALISFWDFQGEDDLTAEGPYRYRLEEMTEGIARPTEGVFGPKSLSIELGQWLRIPRSECPALNFHGYGVKMTIVAWIRRKSIESGHCQAVAGMWNETQRLRQYCLFLNLRIWDSAEQVCGHVSCSGGPTPGHPYCMTSAIGATPVRTDEWVQVAFTYDGCFSKVYLDGTLDARLAFNPFPYFHGIYDGGENGSDFTVGAVHRAGEMGNFFAGSLGGLAVYGDVLSETDLLALVP